MANLKMPVSEEHQCPDCGESNPARFSKDKSRYHRLQCYCKACSDIRIRNSREQHPGRHNAGVRKWQKANPEKYKAIAKSWAANNIERVRATRRKTMRKFCSTEKGRLSHRISNRIRATLKGTRKNGRHWEDLLNYSCKQLFKHLNSTMPKGYSWQDYMIGKLHIDHIIPISAFNFITPEDIDFKKCWALSNLRLLPSTENVKKQANFDEQFQPSFAFGGFTHAKCENGNN